MCVVNAPCGGTDCSGSIKKLVLQLASGPAPNRGSNFHLVPCFILSTGVLPLLTKPMSILNDLSFFELHNRQCTEPKPCSLLLAKCFFGRYQGSGGSIGGAFGGFSLNNGLPGNNLRLLGLIFHVTNNFLGVIGLSLRGDSNSGKHTDLLNAGGSLLFSGFSQIVGVTSSSDSFIECKYPRQPKSQ